MLRLLNFISREEDLTDKSVSDDESETRDFDDQANLSENERSAPNASKKNLPYIENTLLSAHSLDFAKQPDKIQNLQSDITDNEILTDPIIFQTSQVTISNPEFNEQSNSTYSNGEDRVPTSPSNDRREQFVTTQASSQTSLKSPSQQPQHSGARQPWNATDHIAVVRANPEESQINSKTSLHEVPLTSPEARLHCVMQNLRSFVLLEVSELEAGFAPPILFEELPNALRDLAQVMVWADQNEPTLWDLFLELHAMPTLVNCLNKTKDLSSYETNTSAKEDKQNGDSEYMAYRNTAETSEKGISRITTDLSKSDERFNGTKSNRAKSAPSIASVNGSAYHNSGPTKCEHRKNGSIGDELAKALICDGLSSKIQSHVLQTISIMVQSVSRRHSLLCLFAAGHINEVLSFEFSFDEEMIAAFISTVKTITNRLDNDLLQLFFDPAEGVFPLYDNVTKFYAHHESMVRIAIRNITLAIYSAGDAEVLKYVARDDHNYFVNTIYFLSRLSGSVARAFELLLDDGREVRRTRTRTGIFRRKVRVSDVTIRLEEIENICSYLNDMCVISNDVLRPVLMRLISNRFLSPFFRPLASLACPDAVRARNKLWRLGNGQTKGLHRTALAVFDAAARCLLLSCLLMYFRSSDMADCITRELRRLSIDFERRSVLHALKAMASDIAGTERVTFVSLCAIEAFIKCKSVEKHFLHDFKYDFQVDDTNRNSHGDLKSPRISFLDLEAPQLDDLERSHDYPMLMTLSEFEAPLTPSTSLPSTPDLKTVSSDGIVTPTILSRATSTASLSSELSVGMAERSDGDGILSSFQMGETSLREALSSIILVVRRREVRSMRVLHSIGRVISLVEAKTKEHRSCIELCKIVLDELAGLMQSVLRDKRTTIISIERMFESFRTVALSDQEIFSDPPELEKVLSPDRVPSMASTFPKGIGRRRRALFEDTIPPTEKEDAAAFFVMIYTYERCLTSAGITTLPNLALQAKGILLEYGAPDSYLDKRDALISFSKAVLQHGEIE